jgi:long-chain fatty acid transport protein
MSSIRSLNQGESIPVRTNFKMRLLAAVLLLGSPAFATDGYFSTGFGIKQQGHGGAGIAFPQDGLAAATNPAGLAIVGTRFDFGATLFRPVRGGTITGNQLPPGYPDVNGDYDAGRKMNFLIPELGYNHSLNSRVSLGVSMYGNGGMNTSYTSPIPLLGSTNAGVDLQQLFVAPTIAVKANSRNAFGVSVNLAYQRFKADGLENFASSAVSSAPSNVTNLGYSSSVGAGVRVGWLGQFNRFLSFGATYQSRTYMQKLKKYRGLFAEQGGFDIPANFAGGVAVMPHPRITVLFDVERILYGQVKSIANLGSNQSLLGSDNGPGFGWHDITAEKAGIDYRISSSLTIRGGYNHSGLAFENSQTFFNLLAPAVVQDHLSAGVTWRLGNGKEISFAYQHAFENTVKGVSSIPPTAGGGNANLRMYQDSVGVSFGWDRR